MLSAPNIFFAQEEETFLHNSIVDSGTSHRNWSTKSGTPERYTGEKKCKCHQGIAVDKVGTHSSLAWVQRVAKKSIEVVPGILCKRVSTFTNLVLKGKKIDKFLQNVSYENIHVETPECEDLGS